MTRDGLAGCLCCGLPYIEGNGYCQPCNDKEHKVEPFTGLPAPFSGVPCTTTREEAGRD